MDSISWFDLFLEFIVEIIWRIISDLASDSGATIVVLAASLLGTACSVQSEVSCSRLSGVSPMAESVVAPLVDGEVFLEHSSHDNR